MTRLTRRETVLAAAFAISVAVLLFSFRGCEPVGRSDGDTGGGRVSVPSPFTISGDVANAITPGVMAPLDLSLDNPNDHDLLVDRITVTVTDVDAPQADADHPCSAADFDVRPLADGIAVTLEANRVDDLSGLGVARADWPAVGMLDRPVNQDGCKGASLTLGYEASGVEVR